MFLKDVKSGDLVQVITLKELVDPNEKQVTVRFQAGEEVGDPVKANKTGLEFPSGESLPKCWLDPHYRINF
ncbi:MAG TPA: acetyltransferase [Mariprofundaceae bacterium]|nr:acetyltransferase [Mariprofundaceae bacterium]